MACRGGVGVILDFDGYKKRIQYSFLVVLLCLTYAIPPFSYIQLI